jgi:hypothetical protein
MNSIVTYLKSGDAIASAADEDYNETLSISNSETELHTEFTAFRKFPPEIQRSIWKLASRTSRVIMVRIGQECGLASRATFLFPWHGNQAVTFVVASPQDGGAKAPAVRHVCSQALETYNEEVKTSLDVSSLNISSPGGITGILSPSLLHTSAKPHRKLFISTNDVLYFCASRSDEELLKPGQKAYQFYLPDAVPCRVAFDMRFVANLSGCEFITFIKCFMWTFQVKEILLVEPTNSNLSAGEYEDTSMIEVPRNERFNRWKNLFDAYSGALEMGIFQDDPQEISFEGKVGKISREEFKMPKFTFMRLLKDGVRL